MYLHFHLAYASSANILMRLPITKHWPNKMEKSKYLIISTCLQQTIISQNVYNMYLSSCPTYRSIEGFDLHTRPRSVVMLAENCFRKQLSAHKYALIVCDTALRQKNVVCHSVSTTSRRLHSAGVHLCHGTVSPPTLGTFDGLCAL